MDRRRTLKLLAATAASGAFLATTGLKASEGTVRLNRTLTPNENGRGFYWLDRMQVGNTNRIRMSVVLRNFDSTYITVDGKQYWNPIVSLYLPQQNTRQDFEDTKRTLFARLEEYWQSPVLLSESWSKKVDSKATPRLRVI